MMFNVDVSVYLICILSDPELSGQPRQTERGAESTRRVTERS